MIESKAVPTYIKDSSEPNCSGRSPHLIEKTRRFTST